MDVCILRWPEQSDDVERLEQLGVPRLLLVEAGDPPPSGTSCLEDWVRLPAHDADVRARLAALAARAARHPRVPALDEHGQLSYRGASVFLSPVEQSLVQILLASFGHGVAAAQLLGSAWADESTLGALRVHMFRIRGRIAPLGLTITNIRGFGYVMREAGDRHNAAVAPPNTG